MIHLLCLTHSPERILSAINDSFMFPSPLYLFDSLLPFNTFAQAGSLISYDTFKNIDSFHNTDTFYQTDSFCSSDTYLRLRFIHQ